MVNPSALANELLDAYRERRLVVPPSSREDGLSLATAYAVEAEIVRSRAAAGHHPVGLKVGFANKDTWRILKLETLAWAHMYDDTVHRTRPATPPMCRLDTWCRRRSSRRSCSA